tara:strand:- start:934 stop:1230 length:297 start_codon:yes stop_codon:yes gene_type:complete
MIVQLVEIYELNRRPSSEEAAYSLREVFVNPEHVTCLREDVVTGKKLESGLLPSDLDSRQKFTKIHLNRGLSGIDLTVVGDPSTIQEKLLGTKQLLKG